MAKRWVVGSIWTILVTAEVLTCGRNAVADKPRTPKKVVISDVIIEGNRRMTTEKIRALLHTRPGKAYEDSVVNDDVRELYKTYQFSNINTALQEDGAGKVKIYFVVREVPDDMVQKVKVQTVTFLGAKHIKEEYLRRITSVQPGMPFNLFLNLQGCQKIRDKYEEMGRPLASCTLVKGGDLGDTEVVYQITEGPKIKVREIRFTGNTFVTSARLVMQMKSSKEGFSLIGGSYNKSMEADKQELMKYYRRFGYQDVRVSVETKRSASGNEVTLIYHIHEGPRYRVQDVPVGQDTKCIARPR